MELKSPKGTRDFLPQEMVKRQFVVDTIRKIYERYGFEPLDTPVFEDWDVLKVKSGEEAKNQIYYFKDKSNRELGLRFDLTVGMARVVAENPELPKPFKRYMIDKAWRYEDTSKGRYREFVQADIDTIGIPGMIADAECIACAVAALQELGLNDLTVRLNNRKLLNMLIDELGLTEKKEVVMRAMDKLDRIGEEGVIAELKKVATPRNVERIMEFAKGEFKLAGSEEAIAEIEEIKKLLKEFDIKAKVVIDYSLVRGLGYYTGPIFEIMYGGYKKTVAGGGRYDGLIGVYGKEALPATGISIGVERIVDILSEAGLFEKAGVGKTNVECFVAPVNKEQVPKAIDISQKIREAGIKCTMDLVGKSLSKNMEYCNSKGMQKIIIVGPKDIQESKVTVRDMKSGEEKKVKITELTKFLKT
jgi:histidyl-tRNA synthetase